MGKNIKSAYKQHGYKHDQHKTQMVREQTCPNCQGFGIKDGQACPACYGKGTK